ncbi:MAG: thioredoxin fold domain-containing protein [Saprospiraceae bacterium]|nr:thioredoxin fold domain-containing protein [Saprospiraceae bacterium]
MKGIIALTVCLYMATVSLAAGPVNETLQLEQDFSIASAKSKQFSKSQVIIFSANWCSPCIQMKENTLNDLSLVNFLNENTINSFIDIDTKEGFKLLSRFKVRDLPTVLVLDEFGNEIARKKEMMSAVDFQKFISSNIGNSIEAKKKSKETIKSYVSDLEPKLQPEVTAKSAEKRPNTTLQNNSAITTAATSKKSESFENVFGVQIGVFSNIDLALVEISRIQKLVPGRDILILNRTNSNATQFRLVIGAYVNKETATKIKSELKNIEIDGFVKDLSSL